MTPIVRADTALLKLADGLILWIWNQCSAPKVIVLRIMAIGWVIAIGVRAVNRADLAFPMLMGCGAVLLSHTMTEIRCARMPPRLQNAFIRTFRQTWLSRTWRLLSWQWR